LSFYPYPSVGEPVGRLSDLCFEGEHGLPLRPRAARTRVSGKPYEVGGRDRGVNHDGTVVNIDSFRISTIPHSGEGCGDTLTDWIFFKERSNIT
jgi:hypothetical protein